MSYVDAGYAVTLSTLALYAVWVARRRRALSRVFGPVPPAPPAEDR